MEIPSAELLELETKQGQVVRAEVLWRLDASDLGRQLALNLLGVKPVHLDAPPTHIWVSDQELAEISLKDRSVWSEIIELRTALEERRFADVAGQISTEDLAEYSVVSLQMFLGSFPEVGFDGDDGLRLRHGALRSLHDLAIAWLSLGDEIKAALMGEESEGELQTVGLALIAGIGEKTLRNHVGPLATIRSSEGHLHTSRDRFRGRAFRRLHIVDVLNWLQQRKAFRIAPLSADFIRRCQDDVDDEQLLARSCLVAGLVNVGPLEVIADQLGTQVSRLTAVGDGKSDAQTSDQLRRLVAQF